MRDKSFLLDLKNIYAENMKKDDGSRLEVAC